jgi:chemotaxis protein CheX
MHTNAKTYVLPQILDLKATVPLAEGILALRGSDVMLDASRIERLGGQSLQILMSAVATWHADGLGMEFLDPSEPFVQGLMLFGIDAENFLNGGREAEPI